MLDEIVARKNREAATRGDPSSVTTGALLRQWAMERILTEHSAMPPAEERPVGKSVWDYLREYRDEAREEAAAKKGKGRPGGSGP